MKTKWMILPVIAITFGCTRETDNNLTYISGEFILHATSGEKDTRTVLQQDGRVFWSPSDCITVFYGNVPGMFTSTNTEPAASAEFTGSLGSFAIDGETEFRAIYPHSNDIVTPTDEGILSIGLPWEQTGVEGTFADDLFICVAKSKDFYLNFYNVCGGVKFSLSRGDIKKVVFRGNNRETLAGRMAVEFDSDGIPQVTDMTGGKSSVTLFAPDGGTFKEGAFYYLVLVPQSLTKGYTMELWTDELVETVSSEASVTVRRSAWGVLKNLGNHDTPPTSIPEPVDLGLPSGLKWASFNLGATAPEEYGDYYAWGETEPYYHPGYAQSNSPVWKPGKEAGYDWASYKWCMGSETTLTKYCSDSGYGYNGFIDSRFVLELEDDAAHVNLGGEWRMPMQEDWSELESNCTWTWTSMNGVNGRLVTGKNGNSIFLPSGGRRYQNKIYSDGVEYLSSSLDTGWPYFAHTVYFEMYSVMTGSKVYRYYGHSVRPVYGGPAVPVESIVLYKSELELFIGDSSILEPRIQPYGASNQSVTWSSSDESVAKVSATGVVTGISTGSASITVTTSDGGKTATCNVTVKEYSTLLLTPDPVDLGLSVKWASFNLGATKPEEYGDYYAWGETEPYYSSLNPLTWKEGQEAGYDWPTYKWCMGDRFSMTKYCDNSDLGYNGFTDNKTVLDPEDDVAHVKLGDNWRMPTAAEWRELTYNCSWTWTTKDGVKGRLITGANGNSIFLPAAGFRGYTYFNDAGASGYYWSSSLYTGFPSNATYIYFYPNNFYDGWNDRHIGFSVRPVSE